MTFLTEAELDDLYERTKLDSEIIVGSEIRQLIGEIRHHRRSTTAAELQFWFDMHQASDQMALAQWRAAHPDKELEIPDHADLVIWLLDQLAGINRIERTPAGMIDWKMEAERANRLLDAWERCDRVDQSLAKRVGEMIGRHSAFRVYLANWLRCYALDIFPEPDLAKAAEVLKANGMTIDSLSANMGRHILSRVIARLDDPEED
jgi:hypothetical protein